MQVEVTTVDSRNSEDQLLSDRLHSHASASTSGGGGGGGGGPHSAGQASGGGSSSSSLLQSLVQCRDWQSLSYRVRCDRHAANAAYVSYALPRLVKLPPSQSADAREHAGLVTLLLALAEQHLRHATPEQTTNIVWALAKLHARGAVSVSEARPAPGPGDGHPPQRPLHALHRGALPSCGRLLEAACQHAERSMRSYQPRQLAQLGWALGKLNWSPPQQFWDAFLDASTSRLAAFVPQVRPAWAERRCQPARLSPLGMLSRWGEDCPPHPGPARPPAAASHLLEPAAGASQDLSNTIWALARLNQQPPPAWMHSFLACAAQQLPRSSPQGVANVLLSLGQLGAQPGDAWLRQVLDSLQQRLHQLDAYALSSVAGALVKMQCTPGARWQQAVEAALLSGPLAAATAADVVHLSWALAEQQGPAPSDALAAALMQRLGALAQQGAASGPELARGIWAAARLAESEGSGGGTQWAAAQLLASCLPALPAALAELGSQDMANLVHALAALARAPAAAGGQLPAAVRAALAPGSSFIEQLLATVRGLLPGSSPQAAAVTVAALAQLGARPSWQWLLSFYEATQPMLASAAPLDLAMLAWGLARLGQRPLRPWLAAYLAASERSLGSAAPGVLSHTGWALAHPSWALTHKQLASLAPAWAPAFRAAGLAAARGGRLTVLEAGALLQSARVTLGDAADAPWCAALLEAAQQQAGAAGSQELLQLLLPASRVAACAAGDQLAPFVQLLQARALAAPLADQVQVIRAVGRMLQAPTAGQQQLQQALHQCGSAVVASACSKAAPAATPDFAALLAMRLHGGGGGGRSCGAAAAAPASWRAEVVQAASLRSLPSAVLQQLQQLLEAAARSASPMDTSFMDTAMASLDSQLQLLGSRRQQWRLAHAPGAGSPTQLLANGSRDGPSPRHPDSRRAAGDAGVGSATAAGSGHPGQRAVGSGSAAEAGHLLGVLVALSQMGYRPPQSTARRLMAELLPHLRSDQGLAQAALALARLQLLQLLPPAARHHLWVQCLVAAERCCPRRLYLLDRPGGGSGRSGVDAAHIALVARATAALQHQLGTPRPKRPASALYAAAVRCWQRGLTVREEAMLLSALGGLAPACPHLWVMRVWVLGRQRVAEWPASGTAGRQQLRRYRHLLAQLRSGAPPAPGQPVAQASGGEAPQQQGAEAWQLPASPPLAQPTPPPQQQGQAAGSGWARSFELPLIPPHQRPAALQPNGSPTHSRAASAAWGDAMRVRRPAVPAAAVLASAHRKGAA